MRFSEDRIEKLNCSDGVRRDIHVWEPAQPRVLIIAIHGGLAHGGDYVTLAQWFKPHGIATVSWDQQGHDGQKKVFVPSFDVFLDDLDLMINWAKGHFDGLPIFILGHSMGALIGTHYGLRRLKDDGHVRGFIFSSPYYVNAIKTPAILVKMAGVLSSLTPHMPVPLEDFKSVLTHDEAITQRHIEDEKDNIRASKASARFANELLKAQAYLPDNISEWSYPVFIAIAGNDKLANPEGTKKLVNLINPRFVRQQFYPDNYHENFNELNREEIYADVLSWMEKLI